MQNYSRILLLFLCVGIVVISCNSDQETRGLSSLTSDGNHYTENALQLSGDFYTLDNIPMIYNKQDIKELQVLKEDPDGEKLNRFLYEIGLAVRDLTNDPAFNKLIIEMGKDINTGTVYLLDLKSKAPKYYDIINDRLAIKGLSLEYISENMTHKPLTGNPEFPITMEIEKYEPTIEIFNYNKANANIQPIISPNVECQLFEDEFQDFIVAWVYQKKGGFEEIIIGEETATKTTNPVFIVNHTISKEKMIKIGKNNQVKSTENCPNNEHGEFRITQVSIKDGYRYEQGVANKRSEFRMKGMKFFTLPPGGLIGGRKGVKVRDIHKDDVEDSEIFDVEHTLTCNEYPVGHFDVFWNTYERDWNRSHIDLGDGIYIHPEGEEDVWIISGRARFSEDWYLWIPDTTDSHPFPYEFYQWGATYVPFDTYKSLLGISLIVE